MNYVIHDYNKETRALSVTYSFDGRSDKVELTVPVLPDGRLLPSFLLLEFVKTSAPIWVTHEIPQGGRAKYGAYLGKEYTDNPPNPEPYVPKYTRETFQGVEHQL